jgi:Sec-independent protein secretion pathway component TatC
MEDIRLILGWKMKTMGTYVVSFAFFAAFVDLLPIGFVSSSPSLTSYLLSYIKQSIFPHGWNMLLGPQQATETYAITSLVLALLITYPLAAYSGIRLISRNSLGRTSFMALTIIAITLFYAGCVFGYYLAGPYVLNTLSPFKGAFPINVVFGYAFYTTVLQMIVIWALIFTIPAYIFGFIKGRSKADLS